MIYNISVKRRHYNVYRFALVQCTNVKYASLMLQVLAFTMKYTQQILLDL